MRAGLLATVGMVTAALGATLCPNPASAAPGGPDRQAMRQIAPIAAIAADSVVDAYGVGIHLNFLDTPYREYEAVAARLAELGVRHVRDDLYLDAPRQYTAIETVAEAAGVRFDLIMGRPDWPGTPANYVDTVATQLPASAVESLEGVNEWDHFGRGRDWVTEMKDWQEDLYTAAKANPATADLPVLSPALAFRWNYDDAGDLSEHADVANAHMYPGGYPPSNQISQITQAVRQSLPAELPLVTTEAGYHNALNTSNGHLPVPEDVAGLYLPRLLLEHVLRGEQRMYGYELIDSFDDPELTDPEAHFGLLRHDLSPKPAYDAMKTQLALLADPGPSFAPGSLAVTADGLPDDARHLLAQKRDGSFVLLLWRDVSVYDPVEQQELPVAPADVTLRLAEPAELTVHRPSDGEAQVSETTGTALPLQLDGEVTAITIDPEQPVPPPDPTDVTATSGRGSATVSWDLPVSTAAVTGFEVTRAPGGDVQVVAGDVRTYRDTGLENGASYSYTVRALSADGPSAAAVSPAVVPATVPTPPSIVSVRARRHRVTVTWSAADPRGRPVTAYRLACLGKVLEVGPDRHRATIRGLPAGRRLRVAVRARNAVGWSRTAYTGHVITGRRSP